MKLIRNMQLIDLKLVDLDVEQNIVDSMVAQIDNARPTDSIFDITSVLNLLKITTLDYSGLINYVNMTVPNK